MIKKITLYIFAFIGLVALSIFMLGFSLHVLHLIIDDPLEYSTNKDTRDIFGNGRFQVGEVYFKETGFHWFLSDHGQYFNGNRVSKAIISKIEKYIQEDPYVYIVGYYSDSGLLPTNSIFSYYNLETGERLYFDSIDEIPRYTKLNYRTGEIDLYLTLEDVPDVDRVLFEKDVSFWCEIPFWRTCYESD